MEIHISDQSTLERLKKLASQLNKTPEQIVADAIAQFEPPHTENQAFWNAIRGIGDSDDPDLAYHIKDILRDEADPVEGWGKADDTENSD